VCPAPPCVDVDVVLPTIASPLLSDALERSSHGRCHQAPWLLPFSSLRTPCAPIERNVIFPNPRYTFCTISPGPNRHRSVPPPWPMNSDHASHCGQAALGHLAMNRSHQRLRPGATILLSYLLAHGDHAGSLPARHRRCYRSSAWLGHHRPP
jgi:hypothetical protein